MSAKKDGGVAFPGRPEDNLGMSLRDYLAAAALSGLIYNEGWDGNPSTLPVLAYEIAEP